MGDGVEIQAAAMEVDGGLEVGVVVLTGIHDDDVSGVGVDDEAGQRGGARSVGGDLGDRGVR